MTKLILSDAIEARLAQLGHQNDVTAWEIGDIAVFIFDHCTVDGELINPKSEDTITPFVLYNSIAQATQVKSFHSVRDYMYTSKNVPISVREEYPFGRHLWKAIIPYSDGTVTGLRKIADICLSWSHNGVPSVAYVRARLAGKDGGPAKWEGRLKRVTSTCKKLAQDEQAPAFVRRAAELFIRRSVHPPLP